jgi:hypothetical protein
LTPRKRAFPGDNGAGAHQDSTDVLRFVALGLFAWATSACEPERVVGTWPCTSSTGPYGQMPDGSITPYKGAIEVPWSNGFEDGFCGYARARGYCYDAPDAAYELVESPVHSGVRAARFYVTASDASDGKQTRCVREGALPSDAVYGAWYYLAEAPESVSNWNLMFFQVVTPDDKFHATWDVTISVEDNGDLTLHMFDHQKPMDVPPPSSDAPPLRVGQWVHIEFRLKRAADTTGEVELKQDGELIQSKTGIQTDVADSVWGQWYAGNLIGEQTPPDSTVYVDDLTIRPSF